MHHTHCIVRTLLTNTKINYRVFGSIIALPTLTADQIEDFDYTDLYLSKTVLIKLGGVSLISVLNDSCACMNFHQSLLSKINYPLNPLQLRELAVRLAYNNVLLKNHPRYFTEVDIENNSLNINVKLPETYETLEFDSSLYGKMLYGFLSRLLEVFKSKNKEWEIENLKAGRLSYILDEHGNFNRYSLMLGDTNGGKLISF